MQVSLASSLAARIDRGRLARTLIDLIGIPSVNPFDGDAAGEGQGEVAAAHYVAERLGRLGWSTGPGELVAGHGHPRADHEAAKDLECPSRVHDFGPPTIVAGIPAGKMVVAAHS